jgi:hypothetical protein
MPKQKPSIQDGNLTFAQKAEIVQHHKAHPELKQDQLARWAQREFKLTKVPNRTTIGRVLKRKEEYATISHQDRQIKRRRVVTHEVLDTALANWVLQLEHQRLSVTGDLIKEKGRQYAKDLDIDNPPEFSNGWLQAFCGRHAFRQFRSYGESGSAQLDGIEENLAKIKAKIAQYEPKDVYNMDETGLFYNMAPDRTIASRQIEGSKKEKTRITIAFTCNADGSDRIEPLIIGHANKPRCFKKKTGQELGFFYLSNKKAWMTGSFFQIFLKRFNMHVKRKVLLLIDNAPSHVWNSSETPNIDIVCLPPNTTSKLQPMDAGIIASFKCHYRRRQLSHALDLLDAAKNPYKVDQLTAMKWVIAAWRDLDQSVLVNCWKHTGIPSTDSTILEALPPANDTFIREFAEFIQGLNIQNPMLPENYINPAEEVYTHELLTDVEILEAAQMVDEDEGQEEAEANVSAPYTNLSEQEKVVALAKAIAIIEENRENQAAEAAIKCLRQAQRDIRWGILEKKQQELKQTSIERFFV